MKYGNKSGFKTCSTCNSKSLCTAGGACKKSVKIKMA